MQNKVAFIVPYFGNFPSYLSLFINSTKGKPIDILFFTNNSAPDDLPVNIKWNLISINTVKELFKSKLNINVGLDNPYKLCDFKPSYGLVFEDYLVGYHFWGNIDIDLVVGNFEKYINDDVLSDIDFYSGVKEYVAGSLFLFRNNTYCNTLFQKSRDWQKVFTTQKYLGFDECGGHFYQDLKDGKSIFDLQTNVQSITEVLFIEQKKGLRLLFTDSILEPKGLVPVHVTNNKVEYQGKEYLLLHYIFFKTTYYFYINPEVNSFPCYINGLGTFKEKPSFIYMMLSKNLLKAISKKVEINLRKIKL